MKKQLFVAAIALLISATAIYAEDCNRAGKLLKEASQLIENDDFAKAEDKLWYANSLCESSASIHYNLGGVLLSRDKVEQARLQFSEALRLKPNYAKAMSALAKSMIEKNYDRSFKLAHQAYSLEPKSRFVREALEQVEAYIDTPLTTTASNKDAIAVVIGNRKYSDSGVPAVEYANHDADIMRKYLIDSLGFQDKNIIYKEDAKYIDLLTIFGDANDYKGVLYNYVKQGKSDVFVFYSGHGAPDTNSKKAFLAPVDLNPNAIKHSSYPLDQLYNNLAAISREKNAKSVTVVLDACFSGASDSGMIVKNASPVVLEVTQPILTINNGVVFTSSKGNQISSWYPEQKHGLFTYHFLKAMRDILATGKPLTVAGIEQKLTGSDGVNDAALRLHSREQMPQVTGNRDVLIVGDSM